MLAWWVNLCSKSFRRPAFPFESWVNVKITDDTNLPLIHITPQSAWHWNGSRARPNIPNTYLDYNFRQSAPLLRMLISWCSSSFKLPHDATLLFCVRNKTNIFLNWDFHLSFSRMKKYNLGLKNGIKPWSRKQIESGWRSARESP